MELEAWSVVPRLFLPGSEFEQVMYLSGPQFSNPKMSGLD